ncbi:MAG: hypothetical protein HW386_2147 [Gammaproteobacteria bacterium]|nr:hypothetical protein [Gammaproteobacteria bacterium]
MRAIFILHPPGKLFRGWRRDYGYLTLILVNIDDIFLWDKPETQAYLMHLSKGALINNRKA